MLALAPHTTRYTDIVQRLNRASVHKHAEAYVDIDWDAPEFQIDPEDPCWELDDQDPLGATAWYQDRKAAQRARIGLDCAAARAKLGIEFEAILSRGLLEFAAARPNDSVDARYALHEVIEEGQHSLMFQEFVNRAGAVAEGMPAWQSWAGRGIPRLGRTCPELFFCYVLAGEVPIDQIQRRELRNPGRHPLLRRIMQIHVTEEARHVCFAEQYLAVHVPRMSAARLAQLRVLLPFITAETAKLMLRPHRWVLRRHGVPAVIAADAKFASPARAFGADCLRPLVETFRKLDLITPLTLPLWFAAGVDVAAEPRLLGQ
ncbi:MAG TPA: diiron oxygenase [Polyangiales bacterium]|nr:diiron oxygenase [Polyangiales bacterium]